MKFKIFSRADANAAVDQLKPLLRELIQKKQAMVRMHEQLLTLELIDGNPHNYYETVEGKEYIKQAADLEALIVSFEADLKKLSHIGCVVRDIEQGIVDFYHAHNNELVFLNWKVEDGPIGFWYELDSSYRDRQPLTTLV